MKALGRGEIRKRRQATARRASWARTVEQIRMLPCTQSAFDRTLRDIRKLPEVPASVTTRTHG